MKEKIILFYKYTTLETVPELVEWQRGICQKLNLKGRIFLAAEGINGTLGGVAHAIDEYKAIMDAHQLFNGIDWKESEGGAGHFPRLQVTVKKQIVALGLDPFLCKCKKSGEHISPEQMHQMIENGDDELMLLDVRNDYESAIGTFKKAVVPNTENFRDFPKYVDDHLEQFTDKTVVMFCTGGIRCERASAYLQSKHVAKKVYQLKGGIHRYAEKYPDGYFRGKNYVFDARIAVPVTDDILARCVHCSVAYDAYTNCVNAACNKQIIVCPPCIESYHNTCSRKCLERIENSEVPVRTKPRNVTTT